MRISDWSSDVCSSDLGWRRFSARPACGRAIRPKSPSFVETPPELEQRVALDDINRADVEILQRELAVAGADEATDLEAEMFEHLAYLAILAFGQRHLAPSSEERRVGNEGVSTCRSRWAPDN